MKKELLDAYLGMVQVELYFIHGETSQRFNAPNISPESLVGPTKCQGRASGSVIVDFVPVSPDYSRLGLRNIRIFPRPGPLPPEVSHGELCCSSPNFGVLSSHSFEAAGAQALPVSRWSLERREPSPLPWAGCVQIGTYSSHRLCCLCLTFGLLPGDLPISYA